ncbi:MAG: hydrogenase maturation peptidase HycI [Candidatus Nezhaarchaeales archaeon]
MWRKIARALINEVIREKEPSIVILCVGNEFRGDDSFGPYVAKKIKKLGVKGVVKVIDCGTTPENFTDVVREIRPTHVILVDAVDFQGSPGDVILSFEPSFDELSVSTHKPSFALLTKYIRNSVGSKVILLGVQPKSIEWSSGMSNEVATASEEVVKALRSFIKRLRVLLKER